jgi:hypothetical protein
MAAANEGAPAKISVGLANKRDSKIVAKITAGSPPIHAMQVRYYDGDPEKGGQLFDLQTVHFADASSTVVHRALYELTCCGVHTIYTVGEAKNGTPISGHVQMNVVADASPILDHIIVQTETLDLPRGTKRRLVNILDRARYGYHHRWSQHGNNLLNEYLRVLSLHKRTIPAAAIERLKVQVATIDDCARYR